MSKFAEDFSRIIDNEKRVSSEVKQGIKLVNSAVELVLARLTQMSEHGPNTLIEEGFEVAGTRLQKLTSFLSGDARFKLNLEETVNFESYRVSLAILHAVDEVDVNLPLQSILHESIDWVVKPTVDTVNGSDSEKLSSVILGYHFSGLLSRNKIKTKVFANVDINTVKDAEIIFLID